jgi:hypothetical protein
MNLTTLVALNPMEMVVEWIQAILSWLIDVIILPGSRIITQHAQTALLLYYGPSILFTAVTLFSTIVSLCRR